MTTDYRRLRVFHRVLYCRQFIKPDRLIPFLNMKNNLFEFSKNWRNSLHFHCVVGNSNYSTAFIFYMPVIAKVYKGSCNINNDSLHSKSSTKFKLLMCFNRPLARSLPTLSPRSSMTTTRSHGGRASVTSSTPSRPRSRHKRFTLTSSDRQSAAAAEYITMTTVFDYPSSRWQLSCCQRPQFSL